MDNNAVHIEMPLIGEERLSDTDESEEATDESMWYDPLPNSAAAPEDDNRWGIASYAKIGLAAGITTLALVAFIASRAQETQQEARPETDDTGYDAIRSGEASGLSAPALVTSAYLGVAGFLISLIRRGLRGETQPAAALLQDDGTLLDLRQEVDAQAFPTSNASSPTNATGNTLLAGIQLWTGAIQALPQLLPNLAATPASAPPNRASDHNSNTSAMALTHHTAPPYTNAIATAATDSWRTNQVLQPDTDGLASNKSALPGQPQNQISEAELAADLALIDRLEVPDLSAYFSAGAQRRRKRSVERDPILTPMNRVLTNPELPPIERKILARLLQTASDNILVAQAFPDNKALTTLLTLIEVTGQFLSEKARYNQIDMSYHYTYLALLDLWPITETVFDIRQKQVIDDFTNDYAAQKQQAPSMFVTSRDDVQRFIRANYPEWERRGISSADKVMVHVKGNTRPKAFTLLQIQRRMHSQYVKDHQAYYHFAFDHSGLPNPDLMDFIERSGRNVFTSFLHKEIYFQMKAEDILEDNLTELASTPLYFQQSQSIEHIIGRMSDASDAATDSSQHRLVFALMQLATNAPNPNEEMLAHVVNNYAYNLLLARGSDYFKDIDIDIDRLFDSDYIIKTLTVRGAIHMGVTSLQHILRSKLPSDGKPPQKYQGFQVSWPNELIRLPNFEHFIQSIIKDVVDFEKKLSLTWELSKKMMALEKIFPSFDVSLQKIVDYLCKKSGIAPCSASDVITFMYIQEFSSNWVAAAVGLNRLPRKTKKFTVAEILTGKQRKDEIEESHWKQEKIAITPSKIHEKKYADFVKSVQNFETQEYMIHVMRNQKSDTRAKAVFNDIQVLLQSQVTNKESGRYKFTATPMMSIYFSTPLPDEILNLRKMNMQLGNFNPFWADEVAIPVTVLSHLTGQIAQYNSLGDLKTQLKNNPALTQYYKMHLRSDFGDDLSRLEPVRWSEQDDLYDQMIDWRITNIDIMIRSQWEADVDNVAEKMKEGTLILMIPALIMAPELAFIYGLVMAGAPHLIESINSDTKQEQEQHLSDLMVALAEQVALEGVARGLPKGYNLIKNSALRAFRTHPAEIRIPKNMWNAMHSEVATHESNFVVHCPTRSKRAGDAMMCTVSALVSLSRKNENSMASSSVPRMRTSGATRLNSQWIKNLFPEKVDKLLVNEAKPAALSKLTNVRAVLVDPQYENQVSLSAKAFFGDAYDTAQFLQKIENLESGIARLERKNIRLLETNGNTNLVVQIDMIKFNSGKAGEKFLEVSKNGFKAFYQQVDSSKEALADILIHEISHGSLNTLDYVYVGSIGYEKGAVNVFDLINLANKNLNTVEGKYVSQTQGQDLKHLLGSSTNFGGTAGLNNADSVTHFISFLSRAKTNPQQFSKEFSMIEKAGIETDGFKMRLNTDVLLSRKNREAKPSIGNDQQTADAFQKFFLTIREDDIRLYSLSRIEPASKTDVTQPRLLSNTGNVRHHTKGNRFTLKNRSFL